MPKQEEQLDVNGQGPKPTLVKPTEPVIKPPKNLLEMKKKSDLSLARKMRERLDEMELTPEERVRRALRLEPDEHTPQPVNLPPKLREALKSLDPVSRHQVLAVMGSIEKNREKVQGITALINQRAQSNLENIKSSSFAQKTIIHRSSKGTLSQADVHLAKSIVQAAGVQDFQDPKSLGLEDLSAQTKELSIASHELRRLLLDQIPRQEMLTGGSLSDQSKDILFVEQSLSKQMGSLSLDVQQGYAFYKKTDLERIAEIVQNQEEIDQTARYDRRSPLPN